MTSVGGLGRPEERARLGQHADAGDLGVGEAVALGRTQRRAVEGRSLGESDGLLVEERLLQPTVGGNLAYHIPKDAKDIERSDKTLRYRLS